MSTRPFYERVLTPRSSRAHASRSEERDVSLRTVVVGNPAGVRREVPGEEFLENQP